MEGTTALNIPENSGSLLVREDTSRFSGAAWYESIQTKKVMLAGLGGIGSYLGFLLSRLRVNKLWLIDNDVVDSSNLSGQFYSSLNVGEFKGNAMLHMTRDYSNFEGGCVLNERFTEESEGTSIMICGFDNMKARSIYFKAWLAHVLSLEEDERKTCLYIDGRLAAEELQVFCITGDDNYNINRYKENYLFTDEEADPTICSYKQTTFMANMIGSIMTNLFVNFCANECNPLIPRSVPFLIEYNAENMYLKIED